MGKLEKTKSSKFKHGKKQSGFLEQIKEIKTNEPMTALVVFAVLAVVFIILGIFVCKVNPVSVCVIVLLEALLAACLNKVPLWVHIVLVAAEFALGIIGNQILLMIFGAVIYFAAVLTISFMRTEK